MNCLESKLPSDLPAPDAYFEGGVESFVNHPTGYSFSKAERTMFNERKNSTYRESGVSLLDVNFTKKKNSVFSRAKRDNDDILYEEREKPGPGHYLSQASITCTSSFSNSSFSIRPESLIKKISVYKKELRGQSAKTKFRNKLNNDPVFDDIMRHHTYESYLNSRKIYDFIKSKENPHKIRKRSVIRFDFEGYKPLIRANVPTRMKLIENIEYCEQDVNA